MSESELLPCPFCGGAAEIVQIGNNATPKRGFEVHCLTWGCATKKRAMVIRNPIEDARAFAVDRWNTRLTATTPAEKLAEAAELLRRLVAMSRGIAIDLRTAHSARGAGASSEMRSDDRDQRNDFSALTADADRFLAVYKEQTNG